MTQFAGTTATWTTTWVDFTAATEHSRLKTEFVGLLATHQGTTRCGPARRAGSASTLAERLGLPRQKLNYHVRALEAQGLVELVEVRSRRGCTERIMQASAAAYVLSPDALGPAAADSARTADRLSAGYLLALGARAIREVDTLLKSADAAGKTLPTLSIDTEIRFRSAAERAVGATGFEPVTSRL